MNKYLVGGAVRDKLLGLESKDHDYVVVGSSPEEMLAFGYKQVGSNFPVFLHPETGDEYALARREKKVAAGYNGFSVEFGADVTLEEDLERRDLTINAMALMDDGTIVDPFGGQEDLKNGVLKHVSVAFAEDPLRVLRVARFVARYNFSVHPDTLDLCNKLIENGELEHLTPERIWKEVSRMFTEKHFEAAYDFLTKDLKNLGNKHLVNMFKPAACPNGYDLEVSFNDKRQLTPQEVAFFYTGMSYAKHEEFFYVPTDFLKDLNRFEDLAVLFTHQNETFHAALQKFVDQNRAFLTQEKYRKMLTDFTVMFNDVAFAPFVANVLTAADAVYGLDFTKLLVDVKASDIKSVVNSHKSKTLKVAFP
jgi:tRNA nucleotidyltransferase (CCA-adding enzyme)